LIEQAYLVGEKLGLAVWTEMRPDPFRPCHLQEIAGKKRGRPQRQASEYIRNGTAKLLTLFHPLDGQVRVKGVRRLHERGAAMDG